MDNYNTYDENQNGPSGYYELYTEQKIKEAKGVFSRYHLGILAYTLIAYVITFAAQIIAILVFGSEKSGAFFDNIYVQWIFGVAPMYLIGFPVFFAITRNMKKREYKKSQMKISEFFVLFVVAEGVMMVGNLIGQYINLVISAITGRAITNSTSELIEKTPIWLIIVIVVIIGPIIEEMLFRKMMIDRFGIYGDKIAIIVSSVSFGLFHGNFHQFFYATLLGFILGYIYTKTGNTVMNTVMHMIINFLGSVAVLPILKLSQKMEDFEHAISSGEEVKFAEFFRAATVVLSYSLIEYLLALAGIIILIYALTKRMIHLNKDAEYIIPKGRNAECVLGNVGVILFIIFSIGIFVLNIVLV